MENLHERVYEYIDPDENFDPIYIRLSGKDILDEYWEWWSEKMEKKYGKGHELITEENCIEDYLTVTYGREVK